MIDLKAEKQTRRWDILYWMSKPGNGNMESRHVWNWWSQDRRRPRVSGDTIAKDLLDLKYAGYVVRVGEVRHGSRRYVYNITPSGRRLLEDREKGLPLAHL